MWGKKLTLKQTPINNLLLTHSNLAVEAPGPGRARNRRSERLWATVGGGRPKSRNLAAEAPRPGKVLNQRSERLWAMVSGGRPKSRNQAAEAPRPGRARKQRSERLWATVGGRRPKSRKICPHRRRGREEPEINDQGLFKRALTITRETSSCETYESTRE